MAVRLLWRLANPRPTFLGTHLVLRLRFRGYACLPLCPPADPAAGWYPHVSSLRLSRCRIQLDRNADTHLAQSILWRGFLDSGRPTADTFQWCIPTPQTPLPILIVNEWMMTSYPFGYGIVGKDQ